MPNLRAHRSLAGLRRQLDPNSIQTRLTAGFVLATVVGIGSAAGWLGWRTQRILLDTHKEKTLTLAARIQADLSLYGYQPLPEALAAVIDRRTTGEMVFWVKTPTGELVAESDTLSMGSWKMSGVAQQLKQLELPATVRLQPIADWHLVVCASPLAVAGRPVGTLYVAEDITADHVSFEQLRRNLAIASSLATLALTLLLALYIRRQLAPLRQLNQLATTVTADTLAESQLKLKAAPSEVAELARSYNLMLARLAQAWAQQKRLVNDVSHELRTPLTLVQGYLQSTLQRCHTLSDLHRQGLEVATAETHHTILLLQDLLALARLESNTTTFCLQAEDLKPVVLAAVELAKLSGPTTQQPAATARIITQIDAAPVVARIDRERLQRALGQLLDNAQRYTDPAQPIVVRLCQPQRDCAVLQVIDRGPGIAAEHQADIFEPFYRIEPDRSRATGGSGLGLPLAKALIEGMQGTLKLTSSPSQGSTFTITLPLALP